MSLLLAAALFYCTKDPIISELKHIKHLFRKINRKQAIIETSVLLGCMAVIVYGFGFAKLMY